MGESVSNKVVSSTRYKVNEDGSVTKKRTRTANISSQHQHKKKTVVSPIASSNQAKPQSVHVETKYIYVNDKDKGLSDVKYILIFVAIFVIGILLLLLSLDIGFGIWTKVIHYTGIGLGICMVIFPIYVLWDNYS